jgi:hypothetical protein
MRATSHRSRRSHTCWRSRGISTVVVLGERGSHVVAGKSVRVECRGADQISEVAQKAGDWVPIVTTWIEGVDAAATYRPAMDWVDGPTEALNRWAGVGVG